MMKSLFLLVQQLRQDGNGVCFLAIHEQVRHMTKSSDRRLIYCYITCNLNRLPKLLYDNKGSHNSFLLLPRTKLLFLHKKLKL